ncbi:hypothetical protein CDAR_600241 [Caerostris darwini]|uniref:IRF tryptophan pentad repeat domain-containing protein n=1 Tax=Caerostris darwini TaxID=1538125 RepID=A0AAV4RWS4_9ARAC|nr:hypothetical protein CDAR_600241 [Caerostris darwini]
MKDIEKILLINFLVEALDSEKYGESLVWLRCLPGVFCLNMNNHGNSKKWTPSDAAVYTDWDKLKKRFPEKPQKKYYGVSRQRFKSALNRSRDISFIAKSSTEGSREIFYRINLDGKITLCAY